MVTQELREFLNDHKDLIKLHEYDDLYDLFFNEFGTDVSDELIEFNNAFTDAGIDILKYLSPDSWYSAYTILEENVFDNPKFAPSIFGDKYDINSNSINLKIEYSDLAKYLSNSDFPPKTLEDFLANDIVSDWDSDYEINLEDEISSLKYTPLTDPVKNKLKELGIIDDKQNVDEKSYKSNETVREAVAQAVFQSIDAGSQNAALNDFNKELDSAMPEYVESFENDGSNIVLKINLTKLKSEISRLIDDDVNNYFNYPDELIDDIQKGISLDIGDNFKFREPYGGWMDNDDAVFNDVLVDYLL